MTSEAPRAIPDIWKRLNLLAGASKEETKNDIAKIKVIVVLSRLQLLYYSRDRNPTPLQ